MKKFLIKTLAVISFSAAICTAGLCFGCDSSQQEGDGQNVSAVKDMSLCVAFSPSSDILEITESTSVYDYLAALKGAGKIDFEGVDGQYGFFINKFAGVTPDGDKHEYWAFYTTLTEMDGVVYSDTKTTFVYDGVTMYYSMNGVSYTPCVAGESYAIVLQTY